MGRTISYCVWGLLALTLYLFIVVSFNQEYQYHTDIPVSICMFVGYLIFCDMYVIGRSLVMIPWKQCLRQGVICSCDKNTNLVAHFIGSVHRVCICGYYVFLLLNVGSVLFIAAGGVAYPKWFNLIH